MATTAFVGPDDPITHPTNDPREDSRKLRVLTYNVGLLRLKLFGLCEVWANPPYSAQRLPLIPDKLKSVNADIITLQECYEQKHADFLINALKDTHPYHARVDSDTIFTFHNGLLILSKFPIKKEHLVPYRKVSKLEWYLASKSMLVVEVDIPNFGECVFINMHTTAGGENTDPEHPEVDEDREDELKQAIDYCKDVEKLGKIGIILGDLNCGPESSKNNYEYCLKGGYRDTYIEAVNSNRLEEGGPLYTWDSANYLNKIGPHATSPGGRIDHLLLSTASCEHIAVDNVKVVFDEQVVTLPISTNIKSTLSDHYGLVVGLISSKF